MPGFQPGIFFCILLTVIELEEVLMKRKFLGLFLLLSIVAAFSACGGSANAEEEDECLLDPSSENCSTGIEDLNGETAE